MNDVVTRQEFAQKIYERVGADLPNKAAAGRVVNAVLDSIGDVLANKDEVRFMGFGSFSLRQRKASSGTAPDGTKWEKPAYLKVHFKAGKELASRVNK